MRIQSLFLCSILTVLAGQAGGGEWVFSRGSGRTIEHAWWDALSNAMLRGQESGLAAGRIARTHEFMERSARRSWDTFGRGSQIIGEPRVADRLVQADILFQVDPEGMKTAVDAAMKRIARGKSGEKDEAAANLLAFEKLLLGFPRQYVTVEVLPGAAYDEKAGVYRAEVKLSLDGERMARLIGELDGVLAGKGLFEPMSKRLSLAYRHRGSRTRDEIKAMEKKRQFDFIGASEVFGKGQDFDRDRYFDQMARTGVIITLATEFDLKKRKLIEKSFFLSDAYNEVLQRSLRYANPNRSLAATGAGDTPLWRIHLDLLDGGGGMVASRDNALPTPHWIVGKNIMLFPVLRHQDENQFIDGNQSPYLNPGQTEFVMSWQIYLTPEEAKRVRSIRSGLHYPDDRLGHDEKQPSEQKE